MICNDQELATTRERVAKLERLLEDLRKTARPEEWPAPAQATPSTTRMSRTAASLPSTRSASL